MANEDTSNKNEMDRVASETNISTPSQDTDEDTNNAVVAITSNSAVDKCIPEPQASHTGNLLCIYSVKVTSYSVSLAWPDRYFSFCGGGKNRVWHISDTEVVLRTLRC